MDVFEVTLSSITNNLEQLKVISSNVANVNTPGYMQETAFAQKVNGEVVLKQSISSKQGPIKETTRNLDVAILGDGFFQIENNGQVTLSKDGHFHIGQDGFLRHSSGGLVVGESGAIPTQANQTEFKSNGDVVVKGGVVDRLLVVNVDDTNSLKRLGHNLIGTSSAFNPLDNFTVKPRALNSSNVESSAEMIKMIEVNRHLQTTQKVVNAYDQLLNVGINELGKR